MSVSFSSLIGLRVVVFEQAPLPTAPPYPVPSVNIVIKVDFTALEPCRKLKESRLGRFRGRLIEMIIFERMMGELGREGSELGYVH